MENRDPQDSRGNTIPQQGETQQRRPRQPHEHDESADSQASAEPSQGKIGRIAKDDLDAGRVDTDKGPAMDEAYEKTRAGTPEPDKQFRP